MPGRTGGDGRHRCAPYGRGALQRLHRFAKLGTIDLRIDYLRPGIGERSEMRAKPCAWVRAWRPRAWSSLGADGVAATGAGALTSCREDAICNAAVSPAAYFWLRVPPQHAAQNWRCWLSVSLWCAEICAALERAVVQRGVAVGHQRDGIAECQGATRGGVHAEFALQTTDDQMKPRRALQQGVQGCLVEGNLVGPLAKRTRLLTRSEAHAPGASLRVVHQRARGGLVLDDDNQAASLPNALRDEVDAGDDAVSLKPCVFAMAKRMLDVDDEKCSGHGMVTGFVSW